MVVICWCIQTTICVNIPSLFYLLEVKKLEVLNVFGRIDQYLILIVLSMLGEHTTLVSPRPVPFSQLSPRFIYLFIYLPRNPQFDPSIYKHVWHYLNLEDPIDKRVIYCWLIWSYPFFQPPQNSIFSLGYILQVMKFYFLL